MKDKLKFIIPIVLLLVGGGVYKFVLAKPAAAKPPKIKGQVYILDREFLINLAGGRFGKLGVALVLDPNEAVGGGAEAAKPPDGYGGLAQEAVVRDIVTDTLTNRPGSELMSRDGRRQLKKQIMRAITARTDVQVRDVLFTDVAIQ